MELTILVDNHTRTGEYYLGEPGLSYYIEDEDTRLLWDTGYSGIFSDNARKLGIDLEGIDAIVLSHGHSDHTGGLPRYFKDYHNPGLKIIAHPGALAPKYDDAGENFGCPLSLEALSQRAEIIATKSPCRISPNITFLGEIGTYNDFEPRRPLGRTEAGADTIPDDSALVYTTHRGIYVITGCSHAGICNIVEAAKAVSGDNRVLGIVGGFHLFKADDRAEKTLAYFEANHIEALYPCHCTGFQARALFHSRFPVKFELGVGTVIRW
ncbi:MAG: MBL fold metallo-hydrolase [Eubacterium sp.]|nr:MBL fold metallo-hydrolase [Eubacterium sp.]